MLRTLLIVLGLACGGSLASQNYTSYTIGNQQDVDTLAQGGVCMMGGSTEQDDAMRWFLQRANGGDVLVLRASGSDGYQDYLYNQLGVNVNSVETIVFENANASNEAYVQDKISKAEAIWFAGGDQWKYVSYWRNSPVDSLINLGIKERGLVIGGTSAGMAILGGYYFSAQNGTITSEQALSNPYNSRMQVDSAAFLEVAFLEEVITDTHYDNPDRKGRHLGFLAHNLVQYGASAKGIACDEYTAVCIDTSGLARVFGDHPTYDDNAYFLQVNCELAEPEPEQFLSGSPLDWNRSGEAVKVYAIKGTTDGSKTFDLRDWQSGSGGNWEHWYVDNGQFQQSSGQAPNCLSATPIDDNWKGEIMLFPNPMRHSLTISSDRPITHIALFSLTGQSMLEQPVLNQKSYQLSVEDLPSGVYLA
ncbi:MAG: Type 1 glutamine amidotransferase-like domain-containing protein, partial [Bacteroidota bacterium]